MKSCLSEKRKKQKIFRRALKKNTVWFRIRLRWCFFCFFLLASFSSNGSPLGYSFSFFFFRRYLYPPMVRLNVWPILNSSILPPANRSILGCTEKRQKKWRAKKLYWTTGWSCTCSNFTISFQFSKKKQKKNTRIYIEFGNWIIRSRFMAMAYKDFGVMAAFPSSSIR